MKRLVVTCLFLVVPWVVSCAGGGEAGEGSASLTPRGGECGAAPVGRCQIDASRTDEQRFDALKDLGKLLLEPTHPLHDATLAGRDQRHPLGSQIQAVGLVLSTWDAEEKADEPRAIRRRPDGNLHNIAQRLRCAADNLIKLGATSDPSETVCWSLELWQVGRAYMQLASK
jgi:hypothetical protein